MTHPDPAYRYEQEKLADACRAYVAAYEAGEQIAIQFMTGVVTAACAAVYKLSPPAGLVDVPGMFRRDEEVE